MLFDSASDMKAFVTNWIMKYGQSARSVVHIGRLKTFLDEFSMFLNDIREHFGSAENADISDTPRQHSERPSDAANGNVHQSSSSDDDNDDNFKLFEIHRIKNRLDPELVEVPGGYRDIAFKLKIGFVRYSHFFFILHVQLYISDLHRTFNGNCGGCMLLHDT